jgi:hypothetical protein
MKTLEQAREERLDREIDAMIAEKLEGVSLAAVSPTARVKLRGILKKYAKSAHPFRECVRDNMKRFGPGRTEAICASLKDTIKGTTKWRKGGGHAKMSEGEDVVIDADVLLALDAISDIDLQEILLEARALDEYQTVEAVPLLETNGKAEIERWGAGQVELAVLTAKKRKALKPEDFALPPDDYPMEDRAHAINALARGKQHASPEDYKTIKSRVCKRYPGLPACKED